MAEAQHATFQDWLVYGAFFAFAVAAVPAAYPGGSKVIASLVAARWLNGRIFECFVVLSLSIYGVCLLVDPAAITASAATRDLVWMGRCSGGPPLIASALIVAGIVGEHRGREWGLYHLAGAIVAWAMFTWLAWKLLLLDTFPTVGFAASVAASICLIRVMASIRLPARATAWIDARITALEGLVTRRRGK